MAAKAHRGLSPAAQCPLGAAVPQAAVAALDLVGGAAEVETVPATPLGIPLQGALLSFPEFCAFFLLINQPERRPCWL